MAAYARAHGAAKPPIGIDQPLTAPWVNPVMKRYRNTTANTTTAMAGSMAAERLLEPPGPAGRRYFGVHHEGRRPGTGQPLDHRVKVGSLPHGHAGAAEPAADRGQIGVGEPNRFERMPV